MSDYDIGADRHVWESRYAQIDDDLAADPVEPLGDLLDLVEEMLDAAGYETTPAEGASAEPDTIAALRRAREIVALQEAGDDVRHDDAQQAAAELRSLFRGLREHPEAALGDGTREPEET